MYLFPALLLLVTEANAHRTDGTTVVFRGQITSEASLKLIPLLKNPRVSTLRIRSFGGNEEAALQIAEVVRERKLAVEVEGVCMSACAEYILFSSSRSRILPGSVVGFHMSSYAINKWASSYSTVRDYRTILDFTAPTAERTKRLLDTGELKALTGSLTLLAPKCIAPTGNSGREPGLRLTFSFILPTRDFLTSHEIEPPSDWPRSFAEARMYVSRYIRAGTPFRFANPSSVTNLPAKVERCA